ncbi:hypothetical protein SNOG_14443 [Parastagonospora nodorum SN15]|uniref:Uncharacterized protein n=1 Tax=Phaeosphaeria nodorum (strain SN15 / ATCC MYA-4574 / FGSC 10173) TaxID=321614 RepID=Q0U1R6_PHANO|nr:hypothetical protein SNOG_14443 [Parastagonospora nodorum SN15]EAT78314.2 hypothetical protein SNOG_14443 [Parastagonospora nodorum SN15]
MPPADCCFLLLAKGLDASHAEQHGAILANYNQERLIRPDRGQVTPAFRRDVATMMLVARSIDLYSSVHGSLPSTARTARRCPGQPLTSPYMQSPSRWSGLKLDPAAPVTATFEDSMSEDAGPSTRATLFRNDDALSQALRDVSSINLGDIVRLNQMAARSGDTASSVATSSTAVFTHREESTVTKPTSTDTYPRPKAPTAKGKGKLGGSFASSLSGNNGSASEAEVERGALRRNSLFAIGDWADPQPTSSRALKGTIRAKERLQIHGTSKRKKPIVVIEQGRHVVKPIRQHNDTDVITTTVASSQRNAEVFASTHFAS